MKYLITALLLSTSALANTCILNLDGRGVSDTYEGQEEGEAPFFTEIQEGRITLSKEEFKTNIIFKDFEYANCADALIYSVFINPRTNEVFKAVYSNEDYCDGGNSYGYITMNGDTKIIATIEDTDFYCL